METQLELQARPHPDVRAHRLGFDLTHPYVEQCWGAVIGPSGIAFLRRLPVLWAEQEPAHLPAGELARSLGLDPRTGPHGRLRRSLDRLVQFGLAEWVEPGAALAVYTEVAPVSNERLARVRTTPEGQIQFGEADAVAVLGVTKAEVSRMVEVGTGIALSRVVPVPETVPGSIPGRVPGGVPVQPEGSFLVPVVDQDGSRWVTAGELSRCVTARKDGTVPEALAGTGTPDDQFPLREAARLAGVTSQYRGGSPSTTRATATLPPAGGEGVDYTRCDRPSRAPRPSTKNVLANKVDGQQASCRARCRAICVRRGLRLGGESLGGCGRSAVSGK